MVLFYPNKAQEKHGRDDAKNKEVENKGEAELERNRDSASWCGEDLSL